MRTAAAALVLVLACLPAPPAGAEEPVRLKILFTNDVHGYIEPCG